MSSQSDKTNRYYKLHSKIYDLTRWSFLFGRQKAVHQVIAKKPKSVIEIGCGTGRNIAEVAKGLPEAKLYGLDASHEMLQVARSKHANTNIKWIASTFPGDAFDQHFEDEQPSFDCILFSYALTMFNPGWDQALKAALKHLSHEGSIILVDFDESSFNWFKRWMRFNHVVMDGHLVDWLNSAQLKGDLQQKKAYGGLWQYFIYEGKAALA